MAWNKTILKTNAMSKIISFRSKEQSIDINTLPYKYAIPERPFGDEDIEKDSYERECF